MRTFPRLARTLKVGLVVVIAALLEAASARAQQPQVSLTIDPERVGVEDTFVATVSLSGMANGLSEPQLELGSNFRIIATGRSHSISFVNGQTSVQVRYQFTVQPLREGIFDIGPALVRYEQTDLRSGTARVQVVAGSAGGGRRESRNPWAPFFGEPRRQASAPAKVRIVATLDKSQVYVGEQVTYTLKLLTQQSVQSVKPRTEPSLTGLWAEPIDVPNPPVAQRVTEGGDTYTSFLLKQVALFPTTAGTVKLEPAVWDIAVVVSDFLFGEQQEIARASEPLELKVLPLPETGRPAGFSGAVGDFTLSASLDKKETTVNEALLLKLTLAGTGNFKTLTVPELPPLSDFRLYNSTSAQASEPKKSRVTGSRSWEWALVAKAPGAHTIPPLTYTFFDPNRKEYRTATTAPLTIEVAKSAGEPEPVAATGGQEPVGARSSVEPVRRDIAYLKTHLERSGPRPRPLYSSPAASALLLLPIVANGCLLLYGWGRRREDQNGPAVRRRAARGQALARLKAAEAALKKGQAQDVPSIASEAVSGFVADWFDEPKAGLTRGRIEELLREAGVPGPASAALTAVLGHADELGFSSRGARGAEMQALLGQARAAVLGIQKALSRRRKAS